MAKYIINKGEHKPLTKQITVEADSHRRGNDVIQFFDENGDIIKEVRSDIVKTIDIER